MEDNEKELSEKGGKDMAVLAKANNVIFEIAPEKTKDFFEKTDHTAFQKVMERYKKHKGKRNN